jgi:phenylacetate-CoA ligase
MMSLLKQKIEQLSYYAYLINPLIPKKYRICRSFARNAHQYIDFLEQSQWWCEERLKEYQDEKLKKLISYAYENVPYYRVTFDKHGIKPGDIKGSEDLNKIPVLTKEIIRENFPDKIVIRNEVKRKEGIWTTGGSTGEPLKFYGDINSNSIAWASFFRYCRWIGYEWGDSIAVFWRAQARESGTQKWHQHFLDWLQKIRIPNVNCFNASMMGEKYLGQYVLKLAQMKPKILRGYVSALKCLAEYYVKCGIESIRPKVVTTTAEVLSPNDRQLLKRIFNADVFDQYGSAECMSVAFECPEHAGLHTTMEHCVVEFVDDRGNIVEDDKKGSLLITDLDNYTMPFIRYMNGDEGSYKKHACNCGRGLQLIDYVEGRSIDMIRGTNNNTAHGLFFVTLLQELGWFEKYGVNDFEIVQKAPDRLDCSFVCDVSPGEIGKLEFTRLCNKHFGKMHFNIRFVDKIMPGPSGKRRYTRNEVV